MILMKWVLLLILSYSHKEIKFKKAKINKERINKFLKKSNYKHRKIFRMNWIEIIEINKCNYLIGQR